MSIEPAEHVDASDMLERLLAITYDILQADGLEPAVQSIAAGFGEIFGWRYVTIVAASEPGGELRRRAMWGYSSTIVAERLNETIPYPEVAAELRPEYEVFPNCYHVGAESGRDTEHNLYTGDLPRDAPRTSENAWHERDLLVLVLVDGNQKMLGYLSPDHPVNGQVPDFGTLRKMQIFVNLLGLALANARTNHAEVERRRVVEDAARTQQEFFTLVSHEVRSPLTAIRGAVSLLSSNGAHDADRRRELFEVVADSTTRLEWIFEDFLLLSRIDAGQLSLRIEDVDVAKVADESIARAKSLDSHRTFERAYDEPLAKIRADEGRMVQVLTNLLSNAVKYSPERSPVRVELRERLHDVYVAVSNEGQGIRIEDRGKLFTRFGRLSHGNQSTGLGLYICKQLVGMMHGSIDVELEPGRRTTFWFTVPKANADD